MFDSYLKLKRIALGTVLSIGFALLSLAVFFAAANAQGQGEPIVRPDPAAITATAGQTVTVGFVVDGVQNLYGADVRAEFDAAVLEVVDANPAQEGVQITPGSFLKPDFVVRSIADNEAGTIWYASTQVSPTLPVSGTGVLFTAVLRAKVAAADSPITITSVELVDRTGRSVATGLQPTAEAPTATSAPPTETAPTQAPTAAAATIEPATPAVAEPAAAPTAAAGATPDSGGLPPLCASPGIVIIALGVVAVGGVGWWARRRSGR